MRLSARLHTYVNGYIRGGRTSVERPVGGLKVAA